MCKPKNVNVGDITGVVTYETAPFFKLFGALFFFLPKTLVSQHRCRAKELKKDRDNKTQKNQTKATGTQPRKNPKCKADPRKNTPLNQTNPKKQKTGPKRPAKPKQQPPPKTKSLETESRSKMACFVQKKMMDFAWFSPAPLAVFQTTKQKFDGLKNPQQDLCIKIIQQPCHVELPHKPLFFAQAQVSQLR